MKKILLILILAITFLSCGKAVEFSELETRMINGNKLVYMPGASSPYSGDYVITKKNSQGAKYIFAEGHFKNGLLDGNYKKYNSNGVLAEEHTYKKDQYDGPYKLYDAELKLVSHEGTYKNGVLNGSDKYYYDNGNIYLQNNYTNGKLDGESFYYEYETNKKVANSVTYKNGSPLDGRFFFNTGSSLRDPKLRNRAVYDDVVIKEDLSSVFYKNGIPIQEYYFYAKELMSYKIILSYQGKEFEYVRQFNCKDYACEGDEMIMSREYGVKDDGEFLFEYCYNDQYSYENYLKNSFKGIKLSPDEIDSMINVAENEINNISKI